MQFLRTFYWLRQTKHKAEACTIYSQKCVRLEIGLNNNLFFFVPHGSRCIRPRRVPLQSFVVVSLILLVLPPGASRKNSVSKATQARQFYGGILREKKERGGKKGKKELTILKGHA